MNNRVLNSSTFQLVVGREALYLSNKGQGKIGITPAEVDTFRAFCSIVRMLASRKALPPHVSSSPFRVFFEDGADDTVLKLFKKGGKKEDMVPFAFNNVEEIVILIDKGIASWKDTQTLMKDSTHRPITPAWNPPEPTFEGRD